MYLPAGGSTFMFGRPPLNKWAFMLEVVPLANGYNAARSRISERPAVIVILKGKTGQGGAYTETSRKLKSKTL